MFVVFGEGLGPPELVPATFPLPTSNGLNGTSIRINSGGASFDAIMVYTLSRQVAAIVASSTPTGDATITLTFNGAASNPFPVRIVRSSFGIFTVNQAGSGPAVVQNVHSESDRPINGLTRAAEAGRVMILWGTGVGPVSGDETAGPLAGDLAAIDVEVYVGNRRANVLYRGRSGCCAGIDQIVFETPAGVDGCYVPIVVKTGDIVSNLVTMAVAAGGVCSDPLGYPVSDLHRAAAGGGLRVGNIGLSRIAVRLPIPILSIIANIDNASASFNGFNLAQLEASQRFQTTAAIGACTVQTFGGSTPSGLAPDPVNANPLDAGPFVNIAGPNGPVQLVRRDGFYSISPDDYFTAGQYTADNGAGGADVKGFRAQITIPTLVTWTNQDSINNIERTRGVEITWTGGAGTFVTMLGFSTPMNPAVSAAFLCVERAEAGRFTVPPHILLALPPSAAAASALAPTGVLAVGISGTPVRFTAEGLDAGYLSYASVLGKTVMFR